MRPLLLAALFFLINFWSLPLVGVWGSSEAREAHIIELMNSGQSWILPSRNGFVPSKPPLFHWLGASVQTFLGVEGHVAGRVVSLIFASLLVCFTCRVASRVGANQSQANAHGLIEIITCAVLTSIWGFLSMARSSMVDMCFAFFVGANLLLVYTELRRNTEDTSYRVMPFIRRVVFYLSMGLAVLAKGPLAFALVLFCSCAMFSVLNRTSWRMIWMIWRPQFSWLLCATIVLAWYIPAIMHGGDALLGRQLFFENISRLIGGDKINHQPFWFYFNVLLVDCLPWIVISLYLHFRILKSRSICEQALIRALLAGLFLFSIASGKRSSYLLPLYPLFALLLSQQIARFLSSFADNDWGRLKLALRILSFIIVGVLILELAVIDILNLPISFSDLRIVEARSFLRPVFSVIEWPIMGALLLLVFFVCSRSIARQALGVWLGLLVMLSTLATTGLSLKAHFKGFDRMAAQVNSRVSDECLVAVRDRYDEFLDPVFYYLRREVKVLNLDADLKGNLCFVLADANWFASRSDLHIRRGVRLQLKIDELTHRSDRDLMLAQANADFSEPEAPAKANSVSQISTTRERSVEISDEKEPRVS